MRLMISQFATLAQSLGGCYILLYGKSGSVTITIYQCIVRNRGADRGAGRVGVCLLLLCARAAHRLLVSYNKHAQRTRRHESASSAAGGRRDPSVQCSSANAHHWPRSLATVSCDHKQTSPRSRHISYFIRDTHLRPHNAKTGAALATDLSM